MNTHWPDIDIKGATIVFKSNALSRGFIIKIECLTAIDENMSSIVKCMGAKSNAS